MKAVIIIIMIIIIRRRIRITIITFLVDRDTNC